MWHKVKIWKSYRIILNCLINFYNSTNKSVQNRIFEKLFMKYTIVYRIKYVIYEILIEKKYSFNNIGSNHHNTWMENEVLKTNSRVNKNMPILNYC